MLSSWWANFLNPPKYLGMAAAGFDLSDRSVKIVSLEPTDGHYNVRQCFEEEIPVGIIHQGEIVDKVKFVELMRSVRIKNKLDQVVVSLPEEQSFVFQLKLPWMKKRELREAVELQLEENVPLKASEAIFDYEIFQEPDGKNGFYTLNVSVLPQSFVESYVVALEEAGFSLRALELETQAVARSLIPSDSRATHLLVDIGRVHTGFAVSVGQSILFTTATSMISGEGFTKNVERQLGVSFAEAERLKISQGLKNPHGSPNVPMALMPMSAALRDEISRIIRYWDGQEGKSGGDKVGVILSGGQASLPGLVDYLEVSLSLPVSVPHPWGNVFSLDDVETLPPLDRNRSLGFATAIGLALRGAQVKNV